MLRKQAYQPMDSAKEGQFLRLVEQLSISLPLWKMACNRVPDAATVAYNAMHK